MEFENLHYKVDGHAAIVTIDRPPVNALSRGLVADLGSVARQANRDVIGSDVRTVILTAKGKYFSAGADLKERMGMHEAEVAPTVKDIGSAVNEIAKISVPTIAAMQGSAMGGGFEVALAADIRVIVPTAQVGLRETALAIIPGAGGTQRLTRLIGPSNALLWITTAGLFSAADAWQQGAVNFVVPEGELMNKAESIAQAVAKCGPLAVRQAKRAIYGGIGLEMEAALALEFECYKNIIPTRDRIEGLNSFAEKRPPDYKGD